MLVVDPGRCIPPGSQPGLHPHWQLRAIYLSTLRRHCTGNMLLPFTVFFLAAPTLFGLDFGEPWRMASEIRKS